MSKLTLIPFLLALTVMSAHGADVAQPKAAPAQQARNSVGQGSQASLPNPDYQRLTTQLGQQAGQIEAMKDEIEKRLKEHEEILKGWLRTHEDSLNKLKESIDGARSSKLSSVDVVSSESQKLYKALQALDEKFSKASSEMEKTSKATPEKFLDLSIIIVVALCLFALLNWLGIWFLIPRKSGNPSSDPAVIDKLLDEKLQPLKNEIGKALAHSAKLPELAAELKSQAALRKAEPDLNVLKNEVAEAKRKLGQAEKDRQSDAAEISRLNQECITLREKGSRLEVDLGRALESARLSEEAKERAASDLRTVSDQNRILSGQLEATQSALSTTQADLRQARDSSTEMGVRLAASFDNLCPRFVTDPEVTSLLRKLHGEALAGSVSAAAAWSTLTAFASAEADPQAKDFQLHILKRLGTVLVNYWKEQGSQPKDRYERLSHWARCLNEQSKERFNLFVPAIGAPVDRTKMTTATSASVVQEVLCWQVRNPAGANYSLAEVA